LYSGRNPKTSDTRKGSKKGGRMELQTKTLLQLSKTLQRYPGFAGGRNKEPRRGSEETLKVEEGTKRDVFLADA
jgi:hypothetical protein